MAKRKAPESIDVRSSDFKVEELEREKAVAKKAREFPMMSVFEMVDQLGVLMEKHHLEEISTVEGLKLVKRNFASKALVEIKPLTQEERAKIEEAELFQSGI